MSDLRDGQPCSHPGCLSHITHPCEGCGRIGGHPVTIQEQVAQAVAARGYREGWTAEQFLTRQLLKLVEESGEASSWVQDDAAGFFQALAASFNAKRAFDSGVSYRMVRDFIPRWREFAKELADIQVVLMCAAQALSEMTGEPFDVAQAALDKATADVGRGRR